MIPPDAPLTQVNRRASSRANAFSFGKGNGVLTTEITKITENGNDDGENYVTATTTTKTRCRGRCRGRGRGRNIVFAVAACLPAGRLFVISVISVVKKSLLSASLPNANMFAPAGVRIGEMAYRVALAITKSTIF
jgi:hypothetical protein